MAEAVAVEVLNREDAGAASDDAGSSLEVSQRLQKLCLRLMGEFYTEDAGVNYHRMLGSETFAQFQAAAAALVRLDLAALDAPGRTALFLNAYNSLTVHALALYLAQPTTTASTMLEIPQFWTRYAYNIAGHVFTLDDMEHGVLRNNREHPSRKASLFAESDPRLAFAVPLDPRLHFALNCGAKSCPPIRVFTPENLEHALEMAARGFCAQSALFDSEANTLTLSKIFMWYGSDFADSVPGLVRWIAGRLDPPLADALAAAADTCTVAYAAYDWRIAKT